MQDHPDFDRTHQPSRINELSAQQLDDIAHGRALDVDQDDAFSRLKVFDDDDNQLGVQDVLKVTVPCLECSCDGYYQRAELEIPRFGKAEIQSFSCGSCSFVYRKVVPLPTERDERIGQLAEGFGRRIILNVCSIKDLNREVVRSDGSFLRIPAADVELSTRDGSMSTVEGCMMKIIDDLKHMKMSVSEEEEGGENGTKKPFEIVKEKFDELLYNLRELNQPFQFIIEDDEDLSHIQLLEGESPGEGLYFESYSLFEDADEEECTSLVKCGFGGIAIGEKCIASYNDTLIHDCRITDFTDEMVWVEEILHPENGKWVISRDEIRGCEDPGCGCQDLCVVKTETSEPSENNSNNDETTTKELTDYLNKFAEHVQAQEGVLSSQVKQEMNKEAQIEAEIQVLDELD